MAYRKQCDYDGAELGMDDTAYLQIHGSISQQIESSDGTEISYRYLTPHQNTKLAFCNAACLTKWIAEQEQEIPYESRQVIHRRNVY